MIRTAFIFAVLALASVAQAQVFHEDLNNIRTAIDFSKGSERKFDSYIDVKAGQPTTMLPTETAPWAGNYFPMDSGGIATRWQSSGYPKPTLDQTKTLAELKAMTPAEINALSPIEKYDLYVGNYNFKATKWELNNRGPLRKPAPEDWEGFCNGARCAGELLPEPMQTVTVKNKDGLSITFQPADLKALGSASYFYVEKYSAIGSPATKEQSDRPNVAAFDLALRYFIGDLKRPFIIDAYLGDQIWNESVVGYNRTITAETPVVAGDGSPSGAAKKVDISLTLFVLGEVDISESNKPTQARVSSGALADKMNMTYTIYVDSQDRVVDGAWGKSVGTQGVDFAWFGAGRGADGNAKIGNGNLALRFNVINDLFKRASAKKMCEAIFSAASI